MRGFAAAGACGVPVSWVESPAVGPDRWGRARARGRVGVLASLALVALVGSFAVPGSTGAQAATGAAWGATTSAPCDGLDPSLCMLPFPNDYDTVADRAMATGRRVSFPPGAFPAPADGPAFDASPWEGNDGFSPGSTILTHVAGQPNRVVLHTDTALLPRSRRAWSAWNYLASDDAERRARRSPSATSSTSCSRCPVSDAGDRDAEPAVRARSVHVLRGIRVLRIRCSTAARSRRSKASRRCKGMRRTWFAGAWLGYGFHEDGLASAHAVADGIAGASLRGAGFARERARGLTARTMQLRRNDHRLLCPLRGLPPRCVGAAPAIECAALADAATPARDRPRRDRARAPAAGGNAFTYPAFCLRLPLSQLAALPAAGVAHNRRGLRRRSSIATTVARRHAACCRGSAGLLAREGIAADGEIVLYAFPRMLGYVFNPVSFWVCHDANGGVRAVLCEVRNTFGEQHNYLLAHPRRPRSVVRARR